MGLGWVNPDYCSDHRRFVLSDVSASFAFHQNKSAISKLLNDHVSRQLMHLLKNDLLFAFVPAWATNFKDIVRTPDHGTGDHQYGIAESNVVNSRLGDVGSSVAGNP